MRSLRYLLVSIAGVITVAMGCRSDEKTQQRRESLAADRRPEQGTESAQAEPHESPPPPPAPIKPPMESVSDEVRAKRAKIVEAFARLFKSGEAKVNSAGAALVIDGPLEVCNGRVLWKLRQRFTSLKIEDVFDEMNCGEMGDAIDTHSKSGCPPNQHDQLILTEAGARRDTYATEMQKIIAMQGFSVGLLAMGCDATELDIAPCLVQKWPEVKRRLGPQLQQLGFTKVNCSRDTFGAGTDLPVK